MRELKVPRDSKIVVYDYTGMFAVARVAWMFKFFGATDVSIMRGGMQKWTGEGRPTFSGPYEKGMGLVQDGGDYDGYNVHDPTLLVDDVTKMHDLAGKLHSGCQVSQILDSRPSAVYGNFAQISEDLRGGNIPYSLNVPF